MKFSLSLAALAATAVQGFAPAAISVRPSTSLFDRPDSSEAVKAAMEASKKFGATSKEARMAWETVEEMDSSDLSAATAGSLSDEECSTEEAASKACQEYSENLDKLTELMEKNKPFIEQMKGVAGELNRIKLGAPAPSASGKDSPELRAALKEAKEASEKHGATSPEARVAWDTVEEIAAAGTAPAMGGALTDDECLVETMQACEALEELNKALNLKN